LGGIFPRDTIHHSCAKHKQENSASRWPEFYRKLQVTGHGAKYGRKNEEAIANLLTHRNVEEAAKATVTEPSVGRFGHRMLPFRVDQSMLPKPFDSSSHTVFSERSERSNKKLFGWLHRKQKERRVKNAGISPEAVPRKGQEERNKGIASETPVSLAD
jgi:hypothetical protein